MISVDAYRQPYIPFYLATEEFFELCRDRLADGGVLIVNAGHPEDQDDLEKVLSATMAEVFPHVMRDPIEDTNTLLVASEAPVSAANLRRAAAWLPRGIRALAREEAAPARAAARGRRRLHRRQGARRVADRQVDRRVRRRRRGLSGRRAVV